MFAVVLTSWAGMRLVLVPAMVIWASSGSLVGDRTVVSATIPGPNPFLEDDVGEKAPRIESEVMSLFV